MFLCSSKLPDLCLHRYLILADNESLVALPSCFFSVKSLALLLPYDGGEARLLP